MNHLPNEIIFKIFENLHFQTLIKCRLVCKRWFSIVAKIKIKELILNFKFNLPENSFWYSTDRLLNVENRIFENNLNFLNLNLFNFEKLELLKVGDKLVCNNHIKMKPKFDFKLLNQIQSLVHLEIPDVFLEIDKEEILSLPNLKVIYIGQVHFGTLILNTPNLEIFASHFGLIRIELLYPEQIIQLQLRFYQNGLRRFKNLKILKIYEPELINQFRNIFRQLSNLEELHLIGLMDDFIDYDVTCKIIDHLLRQKQNLTDRDLRLFFLDHLLDDDKRFESYGFDNQYCTVFGTIENFDHSETDDYFDE